MKKIVALLILAIFAISCADSKVICVMNKAGQQECPTFQAYGPFDQSELKDERIQYSLCGQNIFWSIVFCETLVVPVLLLGFGLYEPEGLRPSK